MKRTLILFAACLFLSACAPRQREAPGTFLLSPGDLWLRDITLVSVERSAPLEHAHVVVRGERIVSAGDVMPGGQDIPGVTVIDGRGKYLTPGLIDGHVHLAQVPGMSPEQEAAMPALAAEYYRQLPRSYLYFGFTTVVDLNVIDQNRIDQIRAAATGPAVLDCGSGLALANGYPMAGAPAATRFKLFPNFLYDPSQSGAIPPEYSAAEHSPEAAVARVAAGGGVCVKAYYETGFDPGQPRLPVPTIDLIRRVRDASHRRQLPLLLHANSLEAHRFAVDAGVDAVVHGLWNWGAVSSAGDELPDAIRQVIDAEHGQGMAFMPTSRVLGGLADLFVPAFLDQPSLARVLPSALIAWYRTEDAQWFKREVLPDFERMPAERLRAIFQDILDRSRKVTAYVAAHGGRIVFGTDTPSAPTYANPPGFNGYLELRELEKAGVSPRQILAAATVENSRLFGLNDYGTIEQGKLASLLILRENPLTSTAAFDAIESVILKGRVIPRETLAAGRTE